MNTNASASGLALSGNKQRIAVQVSKTNWGYIIGKGGAARKRAAWGEMLAIAGCLMFGTFAYAPWVIPSDGASVSIVSYQISGTITFFVFGALFYLIARKGLSFEVQVDTAKRQLRTARRNRENSITYLEKFDFSQIRSVYMKRSKSPNPTGQLLLEPVGKSRPILVAAGPVRELEPVLQRLIADMRDAAPKVQPRQVRIAPARVAPRPKRVFAA